MVRGDISSGVTSAGQGKLTGASTEMA